MHDDDIVGNAFSDGLSIALSYDTIDAPKLDRRLVGGASVALERVSRALRKYGHGDFVDAPRVSRVVQTASIVLAATTCIADGDGSVENLGPARIQCSDAIFALLGSDSFRKDEEVALKAGEALALYADAFSPKDVVWSSESKVWPSSMDEEFASALPPHQEVRRPQKRSSSFDFSSHSPCHVGRFQVTSPRRVDF